MTTPEKQTREALIEEAEDFCERMTGQPWACELIERLVASLRHHDEAGAQSGGLSGMDERTRRVMANPCSQKVEPNEPFFVLLGRDVHAAHAVRAWAEAREADRGLSPKVIEAFDIASQMDDYRAALLAAIGATNG